MANKSKDIFDWLLTSPRISDLYYIYSTAEDKTSALTPASSIIRDEALVTYINGSSQCYMDYDLSTFLDMIQDPNVKTNINYEQFFIEIGEWIEAQNKAGNYPFPEVTKLEILTSGNLSALTDNKAKYNMVIRIHYFKE